MGKRKHGGLTGLSGFVAKAFKKEVGAIVPDGDCATPSSSAMATINVPTMSIGRAPEDDAIVLPVASSRKRKRDNDDDDHEHRMGWIKKYDATGLVPHYSDESQVPEHLQKYFYQRTTYLSLYSKPPGCLLDEEGWYSITPEAIANHIAERCRCDTIIDAFCGAGGNAIAFAKTCQRVIAIDNNPTRLALARHNAQIYGVAEHIEFILADFISFAESHIASHCSSASDSNDARKIDVIFLSPPWGGPSYLNGSGSPLKSNGANDGAGSNDGSPSYSLASVEPIHGAELFHLARKITKNIAYYLPRNTRMEEVSELLGSPTKEGIESIFEKRAGEKERRSQKGQEERVEVEEAWKGSKLKALTCYFGGLTSGQEDMF